MFTLNLLFPIVHCTRLTIRLRGVDLAMHRQDSSENIAPLARASNSLTNLRWEMKLFSISICFPTFQKLSIFFFKITNFKLFFYQNEYQQLSSFFTTLKPSIFISFKLLTLIKYLSKCLPQMFNPIPRLYLGSHRRADFDPCMGQCISRPNGQYQRKYWVIFLE